MKSGTVAYSVSLAALFLIIYGAAYYFMIDILAQTTKNWPILTSDIAGAIIPALIGAAICLVPVKLLYNKKWALYAYIWLAAFSLLFYIAMICLLKDDKDALSIFLRLFLIMVPAPLIIGGGSALWMVRKQDKKELDQEDYD